MEDQIMMGDYCHQQETSSAGRVQLPPGYRFIPMDYELIFHLQNKIRNGPILIEEIKEVNLYKSDPKTLSETYPPLGNKEWYFFTSRNRKYPNGSRPDRSVGNGYWKATGADKGVYFEGEIVGLKKTLVFYKGRHQTSVKTNWIMHEYRIDQTYQSRRDANDMKLDDWVLCRIHERASKLKGNQQEDDHQFNGTTSTSLVEAATNAEIQTVENNMYGDDAASVLINQDNVAGASATTPLANYDTNGNLATLVTPEYAEMDALIGLEDYQGNVAGASVAALVTPQYAEMDKELGPLIGLEDYPDNVAGASATTTLVNHDSNSNLATFVTPEYAGMDEEVNPFIGLKEYLDNVARASATTTLVNHDSNSNLATMVRPEYAETDKELSPLIGVEDYLDNVAGASAATTLVNHDSNSNLATFVRPEYAGMDEELNPFFGLEDCLLHTEIDKELSPLIDSQDYLVPTMEDIFNTPDGPVHLHPFLSF